MIRIIEKGPTIRKPADYRRVYETGAKLVGRYLILFVTGGADSNSGIAAEGQVSDGESGKPDVYHRIGITVSSKVGGAVTRNLVKRRIRELLRQRDAGTLSGHDAVFVALARIKTAGFDELGADIDGLLKRAARLDKTASG